MTGGAVVEIASKSKKSSKKLKLSDAYATWKKSLAKTPSQESKKEEVTMSTPPQENKAESKISDKAEVQTEEVKPTTEANKPDQPVAEALPEEMPVPVAEVAEILPTDAVEQVTSKVKDLSLKKTAEEEAYCTNTTSR